MLKISRTVVRSLSLFQRYAYATAATAQLPVEDTPVKLPRLQKEFQSLKGVLSNDTLKAILIKPFQHTGLTAVQEEVLKLLPGLSEPWNPKNPPAGRSDLLVRARTGTGKTLAFLVPAIEARVKQLHEAGVQAVKNSGRITDAQLMRRTAKSYAKDNIGTLIISPTRELATQIANEVLKLSYHHEGMEVRLLVGGTNKGLQVKSWARGNLDFVVATPGRLLDILRSEPMMKEQMRSVQTLILDEADTLVEMGFRDDLDAILGYLKPSPERQTFMFSATVSGVVRQISRAFLAKDFKYIDCVDDSEPTHLSIPQYATTLPSAQDQIPHIIKLLAHDQLVNPVNRSKVIVFLPTTKLTQLFASFLRRLAKDVLPAGKNTEVYEIHSKLGQPARTAASDKFRNAKASSVLVTSDVSARGVDYPRVTRVIQVGIPSSKEQYVHRIGRTGRGSNMSGRGDLVLQPFEVGFLSWQLTEIPLKALTTKQLDQQLDEVATKYDTHGPERYFKTATAQAYRHPAKPLIEQIEGSFRSLTSRLDPDAVRITHLASLGYYLSKAPELRVTKGVILEGLNAWTMDACGLEEPPYVSKAFLNEMGLSDGRTEKFGMPGRAMRGDPGWKKRNTLWSGRGRLATRDLQDRDNQLPGDELDPLERKLEVSEFKTRRYGDRRRAPLKSTRRLEEEGLGKLDEEWKSKPIVRTEYEYEYERSSVPRGHY